jgi:acetyl esterase/lipase
MTSACTRACCLLALLCQSCAPQEQLLRPADIVALPSSPANQRIAYGTDPLQFGDLRVPAGKGPFPVVIVIHGGCWGDLADVSIMANFSTTLTSKGVATWNLEYRRVENSGGGWPGTFQDVAAGVDFLRTVAKSSPLDLQRVIAVGHSSGGHLALWAAARHRLPANSPLYVANPLPLRGVISLGGVPDLRSFVDYGKGVCGDRQERLLGGPLSAVPDRYAQASPGELLPLGIAQQLVYGGKDKAVPHDLFLTYETDARKKGDSVRVILLEKSGHFEMLSPQTDVWPAVENAILTAVGAP